MTIWEENVKPHSHNLSPSSSSAVADALVERIHTIVVTDRTTAASMPRITGNSVTIVFIRSDLDL